MSKGLETFRDRKLELPKEIAVAEVDIKIREAGKDVDDALFQTSKRVFGVGSMTLGAAVIYNATKEEDQPTAIIKGIIGVGLELAGLYLLFS